MNNRSHSEIRNPKSEIRSQGLLIAFEGVDGSGKSVQISLLKEYLDFREISYEWLHFPRFDCPYFGDVISRFLRGEMGAVKDIDPYLISVVYAVDRADAKPIIENWLKEGKLVILDRYLLSNVAFQSAKIVDQQAKEEFQEWILGLELDYYVIPVPDLTIYLDIPTEALRNNLDAKSRHKRSYLQGQRDIHETDFELQLRVALEYKRLVNLPYFNARVVECGKEGSMLSSECIHKKTINILKGIFGIE